MKSIATPFLAVFLTSTTLLALPCQDEEEFDLARLEAQFAQQMSGCQMVGLFTTRDPEKKPQRDSYTILKVRKLRDSKWQFLARVEYQEKPITVPLVVDVKWAGDTPVIQVTDMKIPFLGTYTARVVIYRGEYAGTWSGVGYGGQMYGKIVPPQGKGKKKAAVGNWPTWRGADGTCVAAEGSNPPVTWSDDENIKWKVEIPGKGSSSPIIWGDKVYVTTAIETDKEGTAPATRGGRGGRSGGIPGFTSARPSKVHEFVVYALNRQDGSVAWRQVVKKAVPHEGGHATASQASNSPITDGERIYAHFGSRGLHCLDVSGKLLWSKDFGLMRTAASFGEGSSPALHGNTLVMVWDHEGDSFVAAFDKVSGKELWRKARRESTSWSTPLITEVGGKAQVILTASGASRGYDLETGEILWSVSGMTRNPIPSPIQVDGIAYLMSGFQGSTMQAIKLAGAEGNLRDSDNLLWTHRRGTSYVPSAMVYQGEVYFLRVSNGVLSCLDAKTGEAHYEGKRMRRMGTVYSSPVAAAGRIYFTSRRGYTKVIKAGSKYEELATNRLHDTIDGTAAIVGNEIYMRGEKHLYCIAEKK